MNDFFSWRKELNMKKVIIAVVIFIIILVLLSVFISSKVLKHKQEKREIEEENARPNKIYTSLDNSFSIELSKTYELYELANSDEYLLSLSSNNNLNIHISKIAPISNKSFHSIVKADRLAFSQSFNAYSNLSELKELLVGDKTAYTYSFHYLDSYLNQAFFIQIVWLEIDGEYYIFDIDFPLDDLPFYNNIVVETLSSFSKN